MNFVFPFLIFCSLQGKKDTWLINYFSIEGLFLSITICVFEYVYVYIQIW